MRKFTLRSRTALSSFVLGSFLALSLISNVVQAQQSVRKYATRQTTKDGGILGLGSYSATGSAVDNDPQTRSDIAITLGVGYWKEQILDFNTAGATGAYATTITGTTPITVKILLPTSVLTLISEVEVQAITGLNRTGSGIPVIDPYVWNYTNVGTAYSGASLLGLLNGAGEVEITLTPGAAFQGIRVRLTSLVAAAANTGVFHAYIKETAPGNVVCSQPIDILSGVRAGTVVGGIANATGFVDNAWSAIDNNMATFAQVNTGAQVLSEVFHTTIFNTTSKVGDSVRVVIQDPGAGLLDLTALSGFTINLYNGSNPVPVQTILNNSPLLNLRLLTGPGNINELVAATTAVYDRVEIKMGGVASALASLRIYEVGRKNAGVTLTAAQNPVYVYAGQPYSVTATVTNGDNIVWYDAAVAGNVVTTTSNIATTLAQAGSQVDYYAATSRNGCSEMSDRKQVAVHIVGFSNVSPGSGTVAVPYNGSVAITPQNPNPFPVAPVMNYATSSVLPNITLNSTTGALTGVPNAAGTFPLAVAVTDVANNISVGTFNYNLVINNVPLPVNLASFTAQAQVNKTVNVNWATASEKNNQGFAIEHSTNGKAFKQIGTQRSQAENGNSNSKIEYTFNHTNPSNGINYYRLKQTDIDGKSEYSNVVSVAFNNAGAVKLYPNPSASTVTVEAVAVSKIEVYNVMGQMVQVPVTIGDITSTLDISTLAAGNYTVRVVSESATSTHKIVKK